MKTKSWILTLFGLLFFAGMSLFSPQETKANTNEKEFTWVWNDEKTDCFPYPIDCDGKVLPPIIITPPGNH